MWMQIVGKIKLALSPFLNQWWNIAFSLMPTGLTTGRIPYINQAFAINFNFLTHTLKIQTSDGEEKVIILREVSVAQFYKEIMAALNSLGIEVQINPMPVEFADPIQFHKDTVHASYDTAAVGKWWQIQLKLALLFDQFRSPFRGKSSPIQFFWGSFDLNGTRFSGKQLPDKTDWPKGYGFMRYAENEENFAFGFWPGDKRYPYPALYSYLTPAPEGSETINPGPAISYFNKSLSECILPYEILRKAKQPEKDILDFLTTTYKEYAKLAGWDIKSLVGPIPT
jgi:hypothetical protein